MKGGKPKRTKLDNNGLSKFFDLLIEGFSICHNRLANLEILKMVIAQINVKPYFEQINGGLNGLIVKDFAEIEIFCTVVMRHKAVEQ